MGTFNPILGGPQIQLILGGGCLPLVGIRHCRAPKMGVMVQTMMDPINMGIYLTNKKELGLGPKNWAHGGNFKTTAKNHENSQYLEISNFRKFCLTERKLL